MRTERENEFQALMNKEVTLWSYNAETSTVLAVKSPDGLADERPRTAADWNNCDQVAV
jgi:hypothetical protein